VSVDFNVSSLAGGLETHGDLEGIVDPPLETSEGTNHDDTGAETVPETVEANAGIDLTSGATLLVHDGDHSVSWVRHNSAENTSPVTSQEGDHKLHVLGVGFTWGSEDVLIQGTNGLLESDELHDGVWDLSAPEWGDTLVHQAPATFGHHLWPAFTHGGWEGTLVGGLDSDFHSLEWAESDVSNELSAGRGDGETNSLVLGSVLLTDGKFVDIFEDLVETELAEALSTVADEGWDPAVGVALNTFLGLKDLEALGNAWVHLWVSLLTALDDIKWADGGVGEAASEDTASHALGVV